MGRLYARKRERMVRQPTRRQGGADDRRHRARARRDVRRRIQGRFHARNSAFRHVSRGVRVDELLGFGRRVTDSASESPRPATRGRAMAVATGGRFAARSASVKPIGRERPERRARRRVVRVASTRDARLVELYSGIGATRLALEPLVTLKSAIAVDNSDAATAVYAANFADAPRRDHVEHLALNELVASGNGDAGRKRPSRAVTTAPTDPPPAALGDSPRDVIVGELVASPASSPSPSPSRAAAESRRRGSRDADVRTDAAAFIVPHPDE